ncbi:PIG-L deacetylase family protein [Cohnella silvisoli]|uniref:PIG-L deacetylase family protein n=1 Tax=Cohnella silvisoli TaxID=2873699 RepID=A0ABV1L0C6_9BACL|nr:PIG-L deacetylase family protein [Cohnella silvisoli]MCD9025142.1 PIG-L family deacetylase [Cohnella silvisoli]
MIEDVVVERWDSGRPHEGKVFAAVFPHSDDFTFFAGGTLLKMIKEGYKGYFIRLTNDEKDSYDLSIGETIYRIEQETHQVANLFGIEKVYDFNYKNHYMDYTQLTEIRHRLMTLFRFLKVDTVISFDPWGHYEENPEHYLTGKAVEAACWMAGRQLDLPELKDMNIMPHFVTEKYYVARGPQLTNRIIDISSVLHMKRKAIALHATPIDSMWKIYLEKHPDGTGRFKSIEQFAETSFIREACEPYRGMQFYEKFHYIGPSEY